MNRSTGSRNLDRRGYVPGSEGEGTEATVGGGAGPPVSRLGPRDDGVAPGAQPTIVRRSSRLADITQPRCDAFSRVRCWSPEFILLPRFIGFAGFRRTSTWRLSRQARVFGRPGRLAPPNAGTRGAALRRRQAAATQFLPTPDLASSEMKAPLQDGVQEPIGRGFIAVEQLLKLHQDIVGWIDAGDLSAQSTGSSRYEGS